MNKQQLSDAVGALLGSKKAGEDAVNAVFDTIKAEVATSGRVTVTNFGSFIARERAARTGRNPKTGDEVPIAPRRVLVFRPSQVLKAHVNHTALPTDAGEDE